MSDDPLDNDLLAAEYVLGVLPPDQARAFEALALHDPAVARIVRLWEARLAPLADVLDPVTPPDLLWRRLALATGISPPIGSDRGVAPAAPSGWRRQVNLWRAVSATGFAIAASLGFLLLRPAAEAPASLIATLAPAGAPAPAFLIRVAPGGRAVVLAQAGATPPAGRSFELWELKQGAATPMSLGVLPAAGYRQFLLDAAAGTQLLVSVEPPGGSPSGQPTGRVVFSGTLDGI